jgi:uncharacterized protein YjbI with pentapeptide repeats
MILQVLQQIVMYSDVGALAGRNLSECDLTGADLRDANLEDAGLIAANLEDALNVPQLSAKQEEGACWDDCG